MFKDQICSKTNEKHSEQDKSNAPFKSIKPINASNRNAFYIYEQRIGLEDEAPSFAGAFNHLEYSTNQQHDVEDYNYADELTVSSISRLTNLESSTRQVLKPNNALSSIHQWSSPMAASTTSLPSRIISPAFPSNSKTPCYGDSNVQSTLCNTTEDSQLQNSTRKRSIVESMNDRGLGSKLKNNRRKLSLLTPNLSRFSRPSDASDTSPDFSIPLSAKYNSDYEGVGINRASSSIPDCRPKAVLHDLPTLQHWHVEANSFKVADRVNEFVRLRKRTTPFLKQ
ncbi:hypothetical protein NQZ79_g7851 [Umbelopsis isabellina]|nr:hypothetical protein NQZ79_g7851 [Umbelopsis isabellina]